MKSGTRGRTTGKIWAMVKNRLKNNFITTILTIFPLSFVNFVISNQIGVSQISADVLHKA